LKVAVKSEQIGVDRRSFPIANQQPTTNRLCGQSVTSQVVWTVGRLWVGHSGLTIIEYENPTTSKYARARLFFGVCKRMFDSSIHPKSLGMVFESLLVQHLYGARARE
jgi:hypothetical protein